MRVYCAGKWEEKERVRVVQDILIDDGHTITFDWTRAEEAPPEGEPRARVLREHAINDHRGVMISDLYVGLFEKDLQYRGTFAEMGIAIGCGKPCIIIGSFAKRGVFSYHPLVVAWFTDIEEFGRYRVYKYGGEVKIKETNNGTV